MYICIDIGSTDLKYGLLNEDGTILSKGKRRSYGSQGGPRLIDEVRDTIRLMLAEMPDVQGICLATSGMVDTENGSIRYANPHQIPDYTGMPVKALLEAEFGLPCELENDVKAAALAEYPTEEGSAKDDCFVMTIGTGIGGCYIHEGWVVQGVLGACGEIGYMPVRGTIFQDLASTTALCREVARVKNLPEIGGHAIFEGIRSGDLDCIRTVDTWLDHMAEGIGIICCVLNPHRFVIGGGVMANEAYIRPRLEEALQKKMPPIIYDALTLSFARNGNDAGMIGALRHFQQMQKRRRA
ncbi:MAG: ROK family protein [Clostridiales bacterium]|nr:ROK family protein [Clostridiales bacterium]